MNAAEIKKTLADAGVEVYRTRGAVVHVAERVRENLLMDSGVSVDAGGPRVSFVVRAQRLDFPNEPDERLFELARKMAEPAACRGYAEVTTKVTQVPDPGDPTRSIDAWCEVVYEKTVDLATLPDEVSFVLRLDKAASVLALDKAASVLALDKAATR